MFRIYYADGSTFDGDAFNAPFFGVLLILEKDKEHGRRIVSNGDYYVWENTRWRAKDFIGMIDYLQQPGAKRVIAGRMVDNDAWNAAYAIADSDPDFPIRTAHHFHEKKPR